MPHVPRVRLGLCWDHTQNDKINDISYHTHAFSGHCSGSSAPGIERREKRTQRTCEFVYTRGVEVWDLRRLGATGPRYMPRYCCTPRHWQRV
eukprot:scaffold106317_cov57-Phaeocystis_antarctica.AAC.1